ncbi:MAG: radical SAM protein [Thaumarchaeota archaeon]|nr:MAG: radical SAM protein [Nitrososphaerota archaeon]
MIAFGPVPSRRLGKSLGVNNIPAKTCTYSCIYCQVGRTNVMTIKRKRFYSPQLVYREVKKRVEDILKKECKIDYITFVPDGEPTLDINLGVEIELLKSLNIPIAVLTNASLMWREDVRMDLLKADLVSIKIDAVSEELWKRINRPHPSLKLDEILDGILEFSREFKGVIITETMLINGFKYEKEAKEIADFISKLKLAKAYIAIPTRPPAESWVRPAKEEVINTVFQEFKKIIGDRVELLIGFEGVDFGYTGDIVKDLLSVISVHPMRRDAVEELLRRNGASWSVIEELIRRGVIKEVKYGDYKYYIRKYRRY